MSVSYSDVACWYVLTLGDALYTQTRYKKYMRVVPILTLRLLMSYIYIWSTYS